MRDYQGRKCYRVLQGRDTPCPNCTNAQLRQDGFYVWDHYNEYCNRHFLLRDKLIEYSGRLVRLEIASDITKHENVSRDTGERLEFAQKIVENTAILAGESRYDEAVDKVLASVGQYYQADRAYLFQPTPSMPGFWDNTFEWCAPRCGTPARKPAKGAAQSGEALDGTVCPQPHRRASQYRYHPGQKSR